MFQTFSKQCILIYSRGTLCQLKKLGDFKNLSDILFGKTELEILNLFRVFNYSAQKFGGK